MHACEKQYSTPHMRMHRSAVSVSTANVPSMVPWHLAFCWSPFPFPSLMDTGIAHV